MWAGGRSRRGGYEQVGGVGGEGVGRWEEWEGVGGRGGHGQEERV